MTGKAELTTSLYSTHLGLFSLSWSKTLLGRSLHLNLNQSHSLICCNSPPYPLSLRLNFKTLQFWDKRGSKSLSADSTAGPNIQIYWDLAGAKFRSGAEPVSGFYIAAVADGEMVLLVGDLTRDAYKKTGASKPEKTQFGQVFVSRKEHMFGDRVYSTFAKIRGKNREFTIDCCVNRNSRLCISVDGMRVLKIKRLEWKFRGNERIELDGVNVQFSWDVYNWLFEDASEGEAVFMFRFEKLPMEDDQEQDSSSLKNMATWSQHSWSSFGTSEVEPKRKGFFRKRRSYSTSSSVSSFGSSGGSSSILDWASTEEDELSGPVSFSLVVYARRT